MAHEEEPVLTHPGTPENARHVNDYEKFTHLMKWGAIICLVVGLVWLLIVKAYW
jgi:hypothetical protein